jgi:aminopeptidase-like protein
MMAATSEIMEMTDKKDTGFELYSLIERLYPICRSITGNGVRETLNIIKEYIPLQIREVASGTKVFDWAIPDEWNIKDAYIKNANGEKIVDFKKLNLHVLNYSIPINEKIGLDELKKHLFTIPEYPDWIPYRTSYHNKNWGFCISHNQFLSLKDEEYEVKIDSRLEPGALTYGEYYIKGETEEEVIFSCHICHPSLCNDNLSGIVVALFLARELEKLHLKYSYRFLFIPGTIGSITWLSLNEQKVKNIKHGLVLTLLGDASKFHYKKSRRENASIDRIVIRKLKEKYKEFGVIDFYPYGYDERQFCSPGFNLPVGRLSRKPHGEFPEYHTSADNLGFVKPEYLSESLDLLLSIVSEIESEEKYLNLSPKCEPQLGKRGLFKQIGGQSVQKDFQMGLLWVLNLSDSDHSLQDISERSGLEVSILKTAAEALCEVDLLKKI